MEISITELAKGLKLPEDTIERWMRQGRIPVYKKQNKCIFRVSVLKKWAEKHNLSFTNIKSKKDKENKETNGNLLGAVKRGGIFYNIKGDDVTSVLKNSLNHLSNLDVSLKNEIFEKLIEREELTSTGIGKGIAIPHPRSPLTEGFDKPFVITCFLENKIDFKAIDDAPVFIMFILLCPTTKIHLHLLSRLSFCMRNSSFVDFLKNIPSSDDFLKKISEFEEKIETQIK